MIQSEAHKVGHWRYEQLRRAGYPKRLALELAERNDVDLHQAVELVTEHGCTHATAAEILL